MAIKYQQTDFSPQDCSAAAYCSGLSANAASKVFDARTGAPAGSTEATVSIDASATNLRAFYYSLKSITGMLGKAGDWTVRLNNTTGSGGVTELNSVYICRVSSLCSSQETIGSLTGLTDNLNGATTLTKTVSGSAVVMAAGDRVVIVLGISNSNLGAVNVGFTPDQLIDSPFIARATVPSTGAG